MEEAKGARWEEGCSRISEAKGKWEHDGNQERTGRDKRADDSPLTACLSPSSVPPDDLLALRQPRKPERVVGAEMRVYVRGVTEVGWAR
jgi:hypothetical protein